MSIRESFQPNIEEFIGDLRSFATGDYLQADEKEFWDEPFDAAVLPELQKILERFVAAIDDLGADPTSEQLNAVVGSFLSELEQFNSSNHDAVLEPEEKEELNSLIAEVAAATGADDEALSNLPEFE
ncbi:MAG: hypothetical protein SOW59_05555 [Corynebacterium sp.]|nr:hypothetical protein [Corynebacterium sp.]